MCIVDKISEKQFLELVTKITQQQSDIIDIKDALLGSKYNPTGIVHRVTSLEEDVDVLNKKVDNQQEIQTLKSKIIKLEKGMKFWMLISNNKWVAGLLLFAMYAFTIKELRDLIFMALGWR